MESQIAEMQRTIDSLTKANAELLAWKQEYSSAKQSLGRMSTRLRKLCKRLTPSTETILEMQQLSNEIRDFVKIATSD